MLQSDTRVLYETQASMPTDSKVTVDDKKGSDDHKEKMKKRAEKRNAKSKQRAEDQATLMGFPPEQREKVMAQIKERGPSTFQAQQNIYDMLMKLKNTGLEGKMTDEEKAFSAKHTATPDRLMDKLFEKIPVRCQGPRNWKEWPIVSRHPFDKVADTRKEAFMMYKSVSSFLLWDEIKFFNDHSPWIPDDDTENGKKVIMTCMRFCGIRGERAPNVASLAMTQCITLAKIGWKAFLVFIEDRKTWPEKEKEKKKEADTTESIISASSQVEHIPDGPAPLPQPTVLTDDNTIFVGANSDRLDEIIDSVKSSKSGCLMSE